MGKINNNNFDEVADIEENIENLIGQTDLIKMQPSL